MFAQRWKVDGLVAGGFFLASLALYLKTLAPSVLEGDSALFQYAPYTLAVTYPTGYPIYLLLGKLWVTLVPLGSIAYRMNLLSAFLGALDIALIYLVVGQVLESRLPAGIAAALFATLPTFWRWAVVTKSYTLNVFFINILLLLLLLWWRNRREVFLSSAAFTFGLSLGNHSTVALFAPGLVLFLWLTERNFWRDARRMVRLFLLVLLPVLLYLYVPWRGGELLTREGEMAGLNMPVAVARGLVSNYYSPSPDGLLRYFLAVDFTGGMVRGWGEVLGQMGLYYRFLFNEFGAIGIILGALGAIMLLLTRPRLFVPLFIVYIIIVIFVLQYGPQGQQAAFLLPCDLIFTIWIASVVEGLGRVAGALAKRLALPLQRLWPVAVIVAFGLLPLASFQSHLAKIDRSRDYNIRDYWLNILERHPLEPGAGLLAHWADLTPLWYFQQVEGLRSDLFGLFPPFESLIVDWLKVGRPLYIAGPLLRASPGIESRYRMTPWGILVKVSPYGTDGEVQLPSLRYQTEVNFGQHVTLLGYDLEEEVTPGQSLSLYLEWRSLVEFDINYLVSLRLLDDKGNVISRKEDRLVSAWYPHDTFPKDKLALDVLWLPVPADTVPGEYRLEIAVLYPDLMELVLENGSRHWTLGVVTVR